MKRAAPSPIDTSRLYGRLLPIEPVGKDKYRNILWKCICTCGNIHITKSHLLRSGESKSCGCLQKEIVSKIAKKLFTTHNKTHTPEYQSWADMKKRCYNKNSIDYPNYGERGIIVCDKWLGKSGFSNFYIDMGKRPSENHSVDRYPNTNGNYEPTNCRWGTDYEQSRNKRVNVWYEYNGLKMVQADWAKRFNVSSSNLKFYIDKHGFNAAFNYYLSKIK